MCLLENKIYNKYQSGFHSITCAMRWEGGGEEGGCAMAYHRLCSSFYDVLLSAEIYFFKLLFQEHYQTVKQLESRSGPEFCRA